FGGIHRRFEVKGEEQGVLVVDDYGHHPEEIRATLRAAREGFPRRLVVAFQPHRYTRTRDLFNEFLEAFDDADTLVLTDVYSATGRGRGSRWHATPRSASGVRRICSCCPTRRTSWRTCSRPRRPSARASPSSAAAPTCWLATAACAAWW